MFQPIDNQPEQLHRPEELAAYARITEVLAGGQSVEAAPQTGVQDQASNVVELEYWRTKNVPIAEKVAQRDMAEESRDEIRRLYAA